MESHNVSQAKEAVNNGSIKFLDFIVIGASKSGTTTLFQYLRHHPSIYLPPEKDAPFFSNPIMFDQGWERFAAEYFSGPPLTALWGTVTPRYMEDLGVPDRISSVMPQVKLIAVLRHPVDRTFSHYRQQVRRGKEVRSFEAAIGDQLKPEAVTQARKPSHFKDVSHFHPVRSEYGRILRHFLSCFPREQLLVLFMDDLQQTPQSVLDSILGHVGLQAAFSPPNLGQKYHVGGTRQRFPWLIPTAQKLMPAKWLWKSLPRSRRREVWTWFFTQVNVVPEPPTQLPPELRHQLIEFFQPDVRDLEALIGQKVPWQEFNADS